MTHLPTLLIIGPTGGIGRETALAALRRGWSVRGLHRDPARACRAFPELDSLDWRRGDAMSARDVAEAARGSDWILHAANPPQYRNWRGLALPMLDTAIAAARASGAGLALPGNLYNFGYDAFPVISERSPQNPISKKGAVRVEMERRIAAAARDGLRGIILRAPDFFGPHCPASWMPNALVKPGRPVTSVTYPGDHAVGHAWAYLPDLAEAFLRLIEVAPTSAGVEHFGFAGHWFDRGVEFAERLRLAAGAPAAPIRSMPWGVMRLAAPFSRLMREVVEMRYLWQEPVRLDNAQLVARIGAEPRTDLDTALRRSLEGLGCLPAAPPHAPLTGRVVQP